MKRSLPTDLKHGIANLLIEANVNLLMTELIYAKILPDYDVLKYSGTNQKELLRFVANNSCKLALINIGSLLSTEKIDKSKNEFSLLILGKNAEIDEIRTDYKESGLENVRHKSIAHIDITHPDPAGSLSSFIDEGHIRKLRALLDKMIDCFEKNHNYNLGYLASGEGILEGLSEILKSI